MSNSTVPSLVGCLYAESNRSTDKRSPFDLARFQTLIANGTIKTIAAMLSYVKARLTMSGYGSSRAVFILSQRYALKLARNEIGIVQNKAEVQYLTEQSTNADIAKHIIKVYASDKDGWWVVTDLVRPIKDNKEFEQLTGLSEGELRFWYHKLSNAAYGEDFDAHEFDISAKQAPFLYVIAALLDAGAADLQSYKQYGKTADGRVVLLDAGANEDIIDEYY